MKRVTGHRKYLAYIVVILTSLLAACGAPASQTSTGSQSAAPSASTSGVSASAASTTSAASAGPLTTIRLGYVPVMIFAPLFVGVERGYFKQQGLDVKLTPVQGGSDSVVQLAAGNFDVAVGGVGAGLLNAANRGVKFTIVAPMHSERPPLTTPLVISAKRTGEIKSVQDLKGKKVAINATGAATEYWLAQALAKAGLTFNDIKLTSLAFRDVPAALDSGALDAAMLGDPLATINKDKNIVSILSNDFINGFTSTFVYMGDPILTKNPQAAAGFMRAYLKACRDLQGNYMNQDIAKIIEKYTQVPAAEILRSAPAQYDAKGQIPLADINTLQDYFLKRGELEYKTPIDMSKFVNTSLATQAAADLDHNP
ncbi:MAG: ABC transporter substrate-binding protein [Herpetosiphonaceae bacterium]|nr:ABC transporter substrate-binding protein [Herpetosiphonaceae bacterium]